MIDPIEKLLHKYGLLRWVYSCRFRGGAGGPGSPHLGKYNNVKWPHKGKYHATTTPPPLNRVGFWRPLKIMPLPPPPLNRAGFGDHGKFLNRVDLALHTKGAASLGKSWICDWFIGLLPTPSSAAHAATRCAGSQHKLARSYWRQYAQAS